MPCSIIHPLPDAKVEISQCEQYPSPQGVFTASAPMLHIIFRLLQLMLTALHHMQTPSITFFSSYSNSAQFPTPMLSSAHCSTLTVSERTRSVNIPLVAIATPNLGPNNCSQSARPLTGSGTHYSERFQLWQGELRGSAREAVGQ